MEEWKNIVGYEGKYQISSLGRVKSLNYRNTGKEKILKQNINKGYKEISLFDGKTKKIYLVHRLVALHYISNPNNYPCVNHKDEDKTNNCVENLEWCSVSYNNKYGNRAKKVGEKIRRYVYLYEVKDNNLLFIDTFYISNCFRYNITINQIYYYIDTNRTFKSKDNKHIYKLYSKAV